MTTGRYMRCTLWSQYSNFGLHWKPTWMGGYTSHLRKLPELLGNVRELLRMP